MPQMTKAEFARNERERHERNIISKAEYPLRIRIEELERHVKASDARVARAEAERDAYRQAYTAMVRLQAVLDSGKVP